MTSVQNLAAGDFVLIYGYPGSVGWVVRPGIVVERYPNDQITVCAFTRTFSADRIEVGPNHPRNPSRWFRCPPGALTSPQNSYINLLSSMTLGLWTDSVITPGNNWISSIVDAQNQGFRLHPTDTATLQEMFCAQRRPFGTTTPPLPPPPVQLIIYRAAPAHQSPGHPIPGYPIPGWIPGSAYPNPPPGSSSASLQSHRAGRTMYPAISATLDPEAEHTRTGSAHHRIIPWTLEEIKESMRTAYYESDTEDDPAIRIVPWTTEEVKAAMHKAAFYDSDTEEDVARPIIHGAIPSAPLPEGASTLLLE